MLNLQRRSKALPGDPAPTATKPTPEGRPAWSSTGWPNPGSDRPAAACSIRIFAPHLDRSHLALQLDLVRPPPRRRPGRRSCRAVVDFVQGGFQELGSGPASSAKKRTCCSMVSNAEEIGSHFRLAWTGPSSFSTPLSGIVATARRSGVSDFTVSAASQGRRAPGPRGGKAHALGGGLRPAVGLGFSLVDSGGPVDARGFQHQGSQVVASGSSGRSISRRTMSASRNALSILGELCHWAVVLEHMDRAEQIDRGVLVLDRPQAGLGDRGFPPS